MAQPTPASATSLFHINRAISEKQFAQLKLFSNMVGASVSSLEKATRVQQVYESLKGCYKSKQAAALLQSMLEAIGVHADKVAGIGSNIQDLEESKEVDGFAFGELIVTICNHLTEQEFTALKELFADDLNDSPHRIRSPDELFLKLIRAEVVTAENIKKLIDGLEMLRRMDLVQMVEKFRRHKTGDIGQATDKDDSNMYRVGLPAQKVPLLTNGVLRPIVHDGSHGDDQRDYATGGSVASCAETTEAMLTTNHHLEIANFIRELPQNDCILLGQSLGLSLHKLIKMTDMPGDMVAAWLRREDDVIVKTGDPTWRTLANALDSINQSGTAQRIRDVHNIQADNGAQTDGDPKPYKREMTSEGVMKHRPTLQLPNEEKCKMESRKIDSDPVSRPDSLAGCYRMKSHEHGVALIISNEKVSGHRNREGTRIDEQNLKETFRYLGYRVSVRRNCKKSVIENVFKNIGEKLVKDEDDSFVCCILSHGGNNYFYDTDGAIVDLRMQHNSLEMKLKDCRKLVGKPKLFFISCCRGSASGERWKIPHYDGDFTGQPKRGDFAFYFSTLSGEVSVRYPDKGTVYISALCQRLCKHATSRTLSDIHKVVSYDVSLLGCESQVPCSEEQLFRHVYFFDDMFEGTT